MLNKKNIFVLLMLVVVITTMSSVCASDMGDDMANDTSDTVELNENNDATSAMEEESDIDASGEHSSDDMLKDDTEWRTFTELQELINDAEENSEINLEYNYYCDDEFGQAKYGVSINKNLTINGNLHTLDACGKTGVLLIFADDVMIANLYILEGYEDGPGSGVYNEGDSVKFVNCGFYDNVVGTNGSAIYSLGSIILYQCTFEDNYAYENGAAIYATSNVLAMNCAFKNNEAKGNGGAICSRNGKVGLVNCEFYDNNATEGNGGAINTDREILMDYCIFSNNNAKGGDGGAVYAYYPSEDDVSVNITTSIFYDNYAYGNGGALYLDCFTVDGWFYSGAGKSYIDNATFVFNGAQYGGAICNWQYSDIANSKFLENYAHQGGGAIYMNNGIAEDSLTQTFGLNIHGTTTFTNNTAGRYGGAIKIYANPVPLEKGIKGILNVYDNVVFEGNNATTGGALSIIDSNSSVKNAKFKNNHADTGGAVEGGNVTDCTFEGNSEPATSGTTVTNNNNNNNNNNPSGLTPSEGIAYGSTQIPVTIIPTALSTSYDSGKNFQVRVIDSRTGNAVSGFSIILKIYTGSNFKTVTVTTNFDGVAQYSASMLSIGTHRVIISNGQAGRFTSPDKTSSITISKASYAIKAPKKTLKKSGAYKITVKNKASGKGLKGVKLTVKVYTGKKFKTYTIKTNKNGVASLKTKALAKGTHKVVINIKKSGQYNAAKKTSSIKIK
ncbi:hypothetical protein [Methanobrevibacter sp. UBA212]|uniref:hypothetical protein n=1 Tax=Methanobrevibacter sp. UBA212 TaxID=1915476 RepID=UPI0025F0F791|nr:hypothetical protein [Methanobrevibacter sp. UBA212]